jgi:addiction module HigA family antidote
MAKEIPPIHPGEILLEEFLKPMKLSQSQLALAVGVHPRRINEVVLGKRAITANTALRLARFFGNSPQFWMGLQVDYDLETEKDAVGETLNKEVRVLETTRPEQK